VPFWDALLNKALFAVLTTLFFIVALMKASFQRSPIKKPGSSIQAFSSSGGRTKIPSFLFYLFHYKILKDFYIAVYKQEIKCTEMNEKERFVSVMFQ
jgi:hypothetical protein